MSDNNLTYLVTSIEYAKAQKTENCTSSALVTKYKKANNIWPDTVYTAKLIFRMGQDKL